MNNENSDKAEPDIGPTMALLHLAASVIENVLKFLKTEKVTASDGIICISVRQISLELSFPLCDLYDYSLQC